jgi:hypothetical protein
MARYGQCAQCASCVIRNAQAHAAAMLFEPHCDAPCCYVMLRRYIDFEPLTPLTWKPNEANLLPVRWLSSGRFHSESVRFTWCTWRTWCTQAGEASLHQLSHEETSPRNQPAGFEWFAMGLEFERAHVIPCHWVIPRCRVIFFVFRLSGIGTGTSVHIHLGLQRHATSRLSTEGWPQKPRIASTRTEL